MLNVLRAGRGQQAPQLETGALPPDQGVEVSGRCSLPAAFSFASGWQISACSGARCRSASRRAAAQQPREAEPPAERARGGGQGGGALGLHALGRRASPLVQV